MFTTTVQLFELAESKLVWERLFLQEKQVGRFKVPKIIFVALIPPLTE